MISVERGGVDIGTQADTNKTNTIKLSFMLIHFPGDICLGCIGGTTESLFGRVLQHSLEGTQQIAALFKSAFAQLGQAQVHPFPTAMQ